MNDIIRHDRYFESGRKFFRGDIPVAELRGSWYQMGRQYGALLREELRKVLRFAEKNPSGIARAGHCGISGRKRCDELYRGIAETSGLTPEQLRTVSSVERTGLDRMMENRRAEHNGGCCSSLAVRGARTADGNVLFGRNYGWLPDFEEILDTLVLSVFHPCDGANAVAMFNWTGCLYLTAGMNENGLFLELDGGAFAGVREEPGRIHSAWLLWEILLNSGDFAALRESFFSCRPSFACRVGAADPVRAEVFEWHPDRFCAPADSSGEASGVTGRCDLLKYAREYPAGERQIGLPEITAVLDKAAAGGGAKTGGPLFQLVATPAEQVWLVKLRNRTGWTEIPLMNLLKGNGEPV